MPPAEVAAKILPYFSSANLAPEEPTVRDIADWMSQRKSNGLFLPLKDYRPEDFAVIEAIQLLEHRCLIVRVFKETPTGKSATFRLAFGRPVRSSLALTRLGRHALQTNTVRQHLGLNDTPPRT